MIVMLVGLVGCACNPPAPPDAGVTDTQDMTSPTGDTAPSGPCDWPESEPNDAADEADAMVPEQRACGTLAEGDPADNFMVELDDDGWIEVEVEADQGSVANPEFQFGNEDFLVVAQDGVESTDPRLVFQARAGVYQLSIREQSGQGGDRYAYQALVSEVKAPVEWDLEEVEPNDDGVTATRLGGGASAYGLLDDGRVGFDDEDWYRVRVEDGAHDVTIDVDAREHGSGANTEVEVYEAQGENLVRIRRITGGTIDAIEPDPYAVLPSSGGEVLFLVVRQQRSDALESLDRWYVLNVSQEPR